MRLLARMPYESTALTFGEVHAERLRGLLPGLEVVIGDDHDAFLGLLPTADAVAVWRFRQEWFASAPKLKLLVTPAAGRDYFQVTPPAGVEVWYGAFQGPLMAETVAGMMLACCRGLLPAAAAGRRGERWPRQAIGNHARRFAGSRVVVVGFGHIGRAVGRLAHGLGARVTGVNRHTLEPRPDWFGPGDRLIPLTELDGALPGADHVVLSMPASAESDRLFDARRLARLPRHAFLYNVGRGNAVDEEALAAACREGRLAGACLDVLSVEPPHADSPVLGVDTIWLLPHTSAFAPEYMDYFVDELAERLRRSGYC